MYVCLCHAITEHQIRDCAATGAGLEEIAADLGVGTCCGQCRGHAESVIAECRNRAAWAFPARAPTASLQA